MQLVNNVVNIQRGEGFTLDFTFVNADGSPFVMPSLDNPYFLVTITNSKQIQNGRYVINKWCKPLNLQGFYSTQPIELDTFDNFNITSLPEDVQEEINSSDTLTIENYAVYCSIVENEMKYKYCKIIDDVPTLFDYIFTFIISFTPEETINLSDKEYYYSITLVSGLQNENASVNDRQLLTIDYNKPMITPTKLLVTTNMNILGGM